MKSTRRENSVQIHLLGSSEYLMEACENGLRVHLLCPDIETPGEMSGMETRVFALLGMNGTVGMKFTGLYSVSAREAVKSVIAIRTPSRRLWNTIAGIPLKDNCVLFAPG